MISEAKFKGLVEAAITRTNDVLNVEKYSVHDYFVELFHRIEADDKTRRTVLDFSNSGSVDGKYTYVSEDKADEKGPWIVGNEISLMIRKAA